MSKKKKSAESEQEQVKTLASLGLENYEIVEVDRSAISNAEYNPRVMTDQEKRKLREGLKRHGMVSPITWNRRTGRVVGGHQRLIALDTLAGTSKYRLRVAAIDVEELREKELNVLLNNPNAQGDWLLPELKGLLLTEGFDLESAGFERDDMFHTFGEDIWLDGTDRLDELADKARMLADSYTALDAKIKEASREDYYVVVVFRNAQDCDNFLKENCLPENRYQSGVDFRQLIAKGRLSATESPLPAPEINSTVPASGPAES
jgi:hypothetical protein